MGRIGKECHGVRQHPINCLRDNQRKVEGHAYRKRATEIGRSVLMAMLAVVVIVIMGAGRVRRFIGTVVIVGVRHRLAHSRWPIATLAARSCGAERLRLSEFRFALEYDVCSHYRVKHFIG